MIAVVISTSVSVCLLAAPAVAAQGCLPPPSVVLVQVAQVAGSDAALSANVQAVEQADANQGDKSGSQVIQDILVAAGRSGYQWDCEASRLIAPASAGQPAAVRPAGVPGKAGAAVAGGSVAAGAAAVSAGNGGGSGGASDTTSASGPPTSLSAQAAPASSSGGTTNIPIPVIVVGLILCSAALFAAVRRVSRH
jgi:hypothetical protein